jgi:hypothetical protein
VVLLLFVLLVFLGWLGVLLVLVLLLVVVLLVVVVVVVVLVVVVVEVEVEEEEGLRTRLLSVKKVPSSASPSALLTSSRPHGA